jgi:hypothetical protein
VGAWQVRFVWLLQLAAACHAPADLAVSSRCAHGAASGLHMSDTVQWLLLLLVQAAASSSTKGSSHYALHCKKLMAASDVCAEQPPTAEPAVLASPRLYSSHCWQGARAALAKLASHCDWVTGQGGRGAAATRKLLVIQRHCHGTALAKH